jgi:hypothetical protein
MDTDPAPSHKKIAVFGREFQILAEIPDLIAVRLLSQVDFDSNAETDCWRFKGRKRARGYGIFFFKEKYASAHKAAWLIFRGPVPIGFHLHHRVERPIRCMGPSCINPDHLLPLDPRTHVLEYTPDNFTVLKKNQTHCSRGHELAGDNLYVYPGTDKRRCRRCHATWEAEQRREGLRADPKPEKTHCSNGHELTPENTYTYIGLKFCRKCHNLNANKHWRKKHPVPPPKPPKTHCVNGHPWIEENLYRTGKDKQVVVCRLCHKDGQRKSYEKRKAKYGKFWLVNRNEVL